MPAQPHPTKGVILRHVDLLRIFVASPSDVRKERACVRDVVDDANGLLPTNHPVQFKAIGFETDVYSDIGEDVQDVINNQVNINNDIDLTYEFLSKILICLKIDSKINKSIYNLPSCPV